MFVLSAVITVSVDYSVIYSGCGLRCKQFVFGDRTKRNKVGTTRGRLVKNLHGSRGRFLLFKEEIAI